MKTVAFIVPESFGQSYFEKHQNYPERVRQIQDLLNESESKFKKRLRKARLIDKSKELTYRLKEAEKEMVDKNCHIDSILAVRKTIKILKQIAK